MIMPARFASASMKGSDSHRYRNVLKTPTICLAAKGTEYSAKAVAIRGTAKVHDVAGKFRAKYGTGDVKKYYSKFDVCVESRSPEIPVF